MTPGTVVPAVLPTGVAAGESRINFSAHQVRAGVQGAREDFEVMVGQLVRAITPGARMIAANPGDWGIDVLVGDLGGSIVVWQSKYFLPEVSAPHQSQIRESFASVIKNAAAQGFTLTQWTLCIPSSMDGPTAKWWDKWKKRKARETGVAIELWDETELRGLLISPDADAVRRHYYEPAQAARPAAPPETEVASLPPEDADRLEAALFVRQLREAGHEEVTASKQQFFNAELMAREVVDKGLPAEVAALSSADAVVHGVWEEHFNEACLLHNDARLPGLHRSVMSVIRAEHSALAAGLPASPVHTCGLIHRLVDNRRAGWVRHWRQVAADHGQAHITQSHDDQTAELSALPESTS